MENMSRVPEEALREKGIELPPGFYLEEEEDFLFLYYRGEKIANFSSSGANPDDEIKAEVEKHLEKIGGK